MQSREQVSEELLRLQRDNESLQGKHLWHTSLQQAEDFILPESGEVGCYLFIYLEADLNQSTFHMIELEGVHYTKMQ